MKKDTNNKDKNSTLINNNVTETSSNEVTENVEIVSGVENSEVTTPNSKNTQAKAKSGFGIRLDKFFKISERNSSVKQEFIGGFVNFLVLTYIFVVIPSLFTGIGGPGMWRALFLATILCIIIATVCNAFYANLPIIMVPGIGLVSYIVQLINSRQYTYSQTMSICFIAAIIFLLLTVTGLRKKIVAAVPDCIKVAIPAGIGLFILNIGLSSSNSGLLDMLNGTATSFAPIVALVSFIIMVVLYIKNIKGGIFIGALCGTVLDIILKLCTKVNPFSVLKENSWLPPFKEMAENSMFKFDFAGLFTGGNIAAAILSIILVIFAFVLIDIFDCVGTLYATAEKGNLYNEKGEVLNMNRAMLIDGCSGVVSSCFGLPTVACSVESTAGIASGARTGLSSLFTSLFFLLTIFISPLIMLVPVYATAPALVLVGILMFDSVLKIDFKDLSVTIPAVLTIILMPLTGNITFGIAAGLISYTLIMMLTGKFKKINVFTYIISVLFILYFVLQYVK